MTYLRHQFGLVTDSVDHWTLLLPLLVSGIGLGTTFGALFQSILAGVPHRDAGSASGALQAFQQAGGALGVALIGEIFFTWLEHAQAWGATSKNEAFVAAASNATIYEIVVFLVVAALVPFLKPLPKPQGGPPQHEPAPLVVEA